MGYKAYFGLYINEVNEFHFITLDVVKFLFKKNTYLVVYEAKQG